MADAGTSAGRVSIRVSPDTTRFRPELQSFLSKVESGLKVTVKAALDKSAFDRSLRDLQRTSGKVELKADLDAKLARTQIATLSRNRFVDLAVRVNKASLVKAGTAIAALSGGRAVTDSLRNLGTSLSNLDKNLPKIAAVSLAVANIGAAGLASLSGLLQLASGLTQVAGVAVILPGALAGGAVAALTLGLALKDTGKVLGGLKPQLEQFQKAISGNFWSQAAKPIREMADTLLPRFQAGMKGVSTELGQFAAIAATSLTSALSTDVLLGMLGRLNTAISNASKGVDPLVKGFVALGQVGASFLPAMGTAFANLATRFGSFLSQAAADGSLKRWADTGLAALSALGSVVSSVASILSGLFKAANSAGSGNGLAAFASVLSQVATVINGPAFQGALTTFFKGAQAGMSGLATAIKPIGDLFVALAPTIASVLGTAGKAVGSFLGSLASSLAQPAFAKGLGDFFSGIAAGLKAIGPALPAVAAALGALGSVAGTLAASVGGVLGAALKALAPPFIVLLRAITPLIPVLGGALIAAITTLAPAILKLVVAFASGLGPIIAALVPIIGQLAGVFAAVIVALVPVIPPILQLVAALLTGLLPVIVQLAPVLAQLASVVAQVLVTAFTALAPIIPQIAATMLQLLTAVLPLVPILLQMVTALLPLLPTLIGLIPPILSLVQGFIQFQSALLPLATFLGGVLVTALQSFVAQVQGVAAVVSAVVSAIAAVFSGNFAAIPGYVAAAGAGIVAAINAFTGGALSRITSFVGSAVSAISSMVSNILGRVSSGFNQVKSTISSALSSASAALSSAFAKMVSAASAGVSKIVSFVASIPGKAKSALGNVGGVLSGAGADLVRGFLNGMQSVIGQVAAKAADMARAAIRAAKAALGSHSPSKVFHGIGDDVGAGFINGMTAKKSDIAATMARITTPPPVSQLSTARASTVDSYGIDGNGGGGGINIYGDITGTDYRALAKQIKDLIDQDLAMEFPQ